MSERWVYFFGNGEADGSREDKDLLGGKGAGLAEMSPLAFIETLAAAGDVASLVLGDDAAAERNGAH